MGRNAPITDRLPDGADRPAAAAAAVNVSGVEINPCPSRDRPVWSRRGPTAQALTGMAMSLDTCSPALSQHRLSEDRLSENRLSENRLSQHGLVGLAPRPAGGPCSPVTCCADATLMRGEPIAASALHCRRF